MRGFFLLFLPLLAQATIYQWTDSKGIVHFSDTPQPNAKLIKLPSTTPAPAIHTIVAPISDLSVSAYQALQITVPKNQATIFDNQGNLLVELTSQPSLQKNHQFVLLLDGKPIAKTSQPRFELENIDRGEHTLQIQVVDTFGKVLMQSNKVIFYLHRASKVD